MRVNMLTGWRAELKNRETEEGYTLITCRQTRWTTINALTEMMILYGC